MSCITRKPDICKNRGADQQWGKYAADQRLCFCCLDSPKSEISSLWPSSVAVQPGLCHTWSEIPKTGFLTLRFIKSMFCLLVSIYLGSPNSRVVETD